MTETSSSLPASLPKCSEQLYSRCLYLSKALMQQTQTGREGDAWRRDETRKRLKVRVCCLSQTSFPLVADSLYTEPAEFIRSAAGDWWCGFLEADTNSSRNFASSLPCEFCSWQDGTSSGRILRPQDTKDVVVVVVVVVFKQIHKPVLHEGGVIVWNSDNNRWSLILSKRNSKINFSDKWHL